MRFVPCLRSGSCPRPVRVLQRTYAGLQAQEIADSAICAISCKASRGRLEPPPAPACFSLGFPVPFLIKARMEN